MADDDQRADRHPHAVDTTQCDWAACCRKKSCCPRHVKRRKSALPILSEKAYHLPEFFWGHQKNADAQAISREESHARDTVRRVGVYFFRAFPVLDGQSTGRAPAAATIDGATAAAIAAEGELKATIRTFQSDNPSAVYRYYWWHDNCYVRYQSSDYQLVASDYCQH